MPRHSADWNAHWNADWDARLSQPGSPVCAPDWLALREDADAAARSPELADLVRTRLAGPIVVRDLGCGTGSMLRWLAPRLPGPQHWILHDRDPRLLAIAAATPPAGSITAGPITADSITVATALGDLTALRATDLAGTSLVTASALLDLLTADEVAGLASACVDAGCAALLTLTVAGDVVLDPPDPLDAAFGAAFDAHQRRRADGRRLLGPDATDVVVDAFRSRGAAVECRPSPWRLGSHITGDRELIEEWLRGWIGAACVQDRDLAAPAGAYLRRRLDSAVAGDLAVVVGHVDVLAFPAGAR